MNFKTATARTLMAIAPVATIFATSGIASADQVDYTVKAGDTLAKISQEQFGTTAYVEEIAYVNHIANVNVIHEGQTLTFDGVKELGETGADNVPAGVQAGSNVVTNTVTTPVTYATDTVVTATTPAADYSAYGGGSVALANGNTAGATGSYAAQQMAARTGVPASTWEYIIARESNGQVNAYNPSGASGLFQTMPGWGSTATVNDQINSAVNAYNSQGLSAWGM
jgi:probable transglycosylase isaA